MYENAGQEAKLVKCCPNSADVIENADWISLKKIQDTQPSLAPRCQICNSTNLPSIEIASGIADVYRAVYGEKHPDKDLLNPDAITQKIAHDKLIYAVLQDQNQKVLAVAALAFLNYFGTNIEQYGAIRELGKLAVLPEFRKNGYASILTKMRVEHAIELGASSLVSVAVGSHANSQHTLSKFGFRPSGVSIRDWQDIFNPEQRESSIFMHKIIDPKIKDSRPIFVPQDLHRVISIAYESLECAREFVQVRDPGNLTPACTSYSLQSDRASSNAQFFLHCPSNIDSLTKSIKQDRFRELKHLSVTLDIGEPQSCTAVSKLLDIGFCFAGVHPFEKTDLLTLQRVRDLPEGFTTHIRLDSDACIRILNQFEL
jgi:GNAT superfamily N-acetyltransferase